MWVGGRVWDLLVAAPRGVARRVRAIVPEEQKDGKIERRKVEGRICTRKIEGRKPLSRAAWFGSRVWGGVIRLGVITYQ